MKTVKKQNVGNNLQNGLILFEKFFILFLIFFAPATILLIQGSTSATLILLCLISIFYAAIPHKNSNYFQPIKDFHYYALASICFTITIPIQQLISQQWDPRTLDAISRFTLAIPVFLFLSTIDPKKLLQFFGWGCAAGAIGTFGWAIFASPPQIWAATNRLGNFYTNPIPFGDIALLLGFLSITTLQKHEKKIFLVVSIRFLALLCGTYVSYRSGSRGGWIAIPFLILVALLQNKIHLHKRMLYSLAAISCIILATLFSRPLARHRISDIFSNLSSFDSGNADTSIGLRLSLWRASTKLFSEHPLFGVGKGHLNSALKQLAETGQLIPQAVNQHAHSDFFSILAEMGLIGIFCLFFLYFGMFYYFWTNRQSNLDIVRTAAYSGLTIVASTVLFGLTIDVLVPVMQVSFIALSTAVMLAAINKSKKNNIAIT